MNIGWEQMLALAALAAAASVGLGLVFLAAVLVRGLFRWAAGTGAPAARHRVEAVGAPLPPPGALAASDLFAIRSNLDAVSRQLEDLERKLRLSPAPERSLNAGRKTFAREGAR